MHHVQRLSVPIPESAAVAAIVLPFLTAFFNPGIQSLLSRSQKKKPVSQNAFSISAVILFIFLTIYDTVIATLSIEHLVPSAVLTCSLEQRWQSLFSTKAAGTIRRIQDRHNCCGFNSAEDRAWPFPDRTHAATACRDAFGRTNGCRDPWRGDEQMVAGFLLLVAVITFSTKVCRAHL